MSPRWAIIVEIPRSRMGEREVYYGKVSSRRFRYVLGYCHVRVVLEEVDDANWRRGRPRLRLFRRVRLGVA